MTNNNNNDNNFKTNTIRPVSFDFRVFDSSKLLIFKGGNSHVRRIR